MTSQQLILRQPNAFLPIDMSLVALALVLGQLARAGIARQANEGAAAHLWQILIAMQVPNVAYFAIKHLPQ